eukprot:COSAG02_NODE_25792_length_649_cov_0.721818_1_plen_130_part_00
MVAGQGRGRRNRSSGQHRQSDADFDDTENVFQRLGCQPPAPTPTIAKPKPKPKRRSKHTGVFWCSSSAKWWATIAPGKDDNMLTAAGKPKKSVHLGTFPGTVVGEEAAARTYREAAAAGSDGQLSLFLK